MPNPLRTATGQNQRTLNPEGPLNPMMLVKTKKKGVLDVVLSRTPCCVFCCCVVWCRRFLTLPQPPGCSTISAGRLSFRVRNGSGRFPAAIGHRQTLRAYSGCWCCVRYCVVDASDSDFLSWCLFVLQYPGWVWCVCFGLLVPVAFTPCGASRSGLSTPSSVGDLK